MKKRFWMTFLAVMLTLTACGTPATPTSLPATVVPATPQTGFSSPDAVIASAEAAPAQDTQISFVISAPVKEVLVKEGDVVTAGQTLMTLYSPDLELAVTSAELALEAAELEFTYWIPARHNRPPERRQQAEAELEQAKKKLETAKAELAQTIMTAPYTATVVDVNVQVGEIAQTGRVMITLGDIANMQIKTTDLSERDVPNVQPGQSVNVYIEALDITVTGKVLRISPVSETVGGDVVYPVTITLDEQPEGLLWGMSAEVEIAVK